MSNAVRALKDEAYRQTLSTEEQAVLPVNPVGEIELTQAELEAIAGAWWGNSPAYHIDDDKVDSQTEQNITIQPVFGSGSGTISILGGGGTQCNNFFSPTTSRATDYY